MEIHWLPVLCLKWCVCDHFQIFCSDIQVSLGAERQGLWEQSSPYVLRLQGCWGIQREAQEGDFPARNGRVTILFSVLKVSFAFQFRVRGETLPQKLILISLKQNSNRNHKMMKGWGNRTPGRLSGNGFFSLEKEQLRVTSRKSNFAAGWRTSSWTIKRMV